jgi:lipoic acid synthetase
VEPAEFERYRAAGLGLGFKYVASGPLVRSSYRAAEAFLEGVLQREGGAAAGPSTQPAPYSDRYGKRRLEVVS